MVLPKIHNDHVEKIKQVVREFVQPSSKSPNSAHKLQYALGVLACLGASPSFCATVAGAFPGLAASGLEANSDAELVSTVTAFADCGAFLDSVYNQLLVYASDTNDVAFQGKKRFTQQNGKSVDECVARVEKYIEDQEDKVCKLFW